MVGSIYLSYYLSHTGLKLLKVINQHLQRFNKLDIAVLTSDRLHEALPVYAGNTSININSHGINSDRNRL